MNNPPEFQPATTQNSGGVSIAGMVLGIVGILTSWFGLGLLLGIAGIVLSSMGIKRKANAGIAIAGLVTSICAVLFAIPVILFITLAATTGISTRANDTKVEVYATNVQKVVESYNANNDAYPSYSQLIAYGPSQGLNQETLDNLGNYKSTKQVTFLSCGTKGSVIYYEQFESIIPVQISSGETTDCVY